MDLKICGIIDIIVVVSFVLVAILGYRKGFIKKALGMVGLLVGLIVAFTFCNAFAGWLEKTGFIYDGIYNSILENATNAILEAGGGSTSVEDALINMGVWKFFAHLFAKNIPADSTIVLAENISAYFAHILTVIISFFILFIGVFILSIILKIIANILRENKTFRIIDGILGIVFYGSLFLILLFTVFTILRFFAPLEFFESSQEFLNVDMMLTDPSKFRISKFFYEHNPIFSILDIFI
ncbi:MAG: CvpA family protein [Anaeroplasmataceae bacterium]|nr:CvpA family protein [Anaeroplasmataceae bacterium]